jgi:putative DNA primase/helicase
VSATETEQDRRLREVRVKALTGGDPIKGRFMHKNFFTFLPTHKFWIAGNHKPVVVGQDPGIWRRIHLVPFTVNLEEQLKDNLVRDFAATLTDELPGILAWIIEGARHWYADGLRPPAIVSAATADYRAEMDAVGEWFEEFCERGTGGAYRTPFKVLYKAYVEENGAEALSKRSFSQELDRLGIHNQKIGGIKVRCGCRLRTPTHERTTQDE